MTETNLQEQNSQVFKDGEVPTRKRRAKGAAVKELIDQIPESYPNAAKNHSQKEEISLSCTGTIHALRKDFEFTLVMKEIL